MLVDESDRKNKKVETTMTQQSSNSEEGDSNSNYENERKKLQMRREARRKKILENSKDRLAKLGGKEIPVSNGFAAYEEVSDPEVEPDINNMYSSQLSAEEFENFQLPQNLDFNALLAGMRPNTAPSMASTDPGAGLGVGSSIKPKEENLWQRTRLHVILIALMTFVLTVNQVAAGWSVFTLLGVCLISELLFFTRETDVGPLVNLAILLCGVKPQLAKRLMHLMLILYNIFSDLGIFVFCYTMLSIMYVLWDENNADFLTIP